MVAIFKTDVFDHRTAQLIVRHLQQRYPAFTINFDLEDCDRILRVEGLEIPSSMITRAMSILGFFCEELF